MKFKGTLRVPRVNFSAYRQALQEHLGDAIARAAVQWLGATTAEIPVWSGASLATFIPLASEIGFSLAASPLAGVPDRVNLGLSNATGEVIADASKGVFRFRYSTSLAHLIYNEFNNANISPDPTLFARLIKPGPYDFQKKGEEAFRKEAESVRLPAPTFSITSVRVK